VDDGGGNRGWDFGGGGTIAEKTDFLNILHDFFSQ
jgi:hypothetical protein